MNVCFEKWHGCKNDFIVVWLSDNDSHTFESLKRQAPELCLRDGSGIGADGILVLHIKAQTDHLPHALSIINSDGSLASNCGNGLRCCAASVLKRFLDREILGQLPEIVELKVGERVFYCTFLSDDLTKSQLHKLPYVSIEMGLPVTGQQLAWQSHAQSEVERLAKDHSLQTNKADVHGCEIGNQHIIVMNQDSRDHKLFNILGSNLQKDATWKGGINVHICEPAQLTKSDQQRASQDIGQSITEVFKAVPWERGVGPTNACGSGACAIAAVAFDTADASRAEWIAIDMPGGRLYARQDDEESSIILAGPAVFVFAGELVI